jgi:hypothetical protein
MSMRTLMLGLLLTTAMVSAAEDSPLVALAKRTNRKAAKTPVITNATLAGSTIGKGRVSMPAGEALPLPRVPSAAAPQAAATPAAAPAPRAAAAAPVATTTPAYPSSTARIIEPQSSIRSIVPSAAAGMAPQSTARNVETQAVAPVKPPQ